MNVVGMDLTEYLPTVDKESEVKHKTAIFADQGVYLVIDVHI